MTFCSALRLRRSASDSCSTTTSSSRHCTSEQHCTLQYALHVQQQQHVRALLAGHALRLPRNASDNCRIVASSGDRQQQPRYVRAALCLLCPALATQRLDSCRRRKAVAARSQSFTTFCSALMNVLDMRCACLVTLQPAAGEYAATGTGTAALGER
jgi:hypothetical protein